ncbi:18K peptidoglycan-associated outer membrane lipoprotein [Sulfuriferula multivorans]|uniref:Peptidoglycan-associated lipoprotein n=1 Tax=Sulfuriferula multivorans TaxID=1559896 RepID=A0A401JFC8_9PROT|nr:peptidoglycan-associated lipoprotein Pal [Sulfuriferula multivorans]GBL46316.1 18K peptidoglycan-associated outer membrane lipoprotein [Sulfuriferula multivorans]
MNKMILSLLLVGVLAGCSSMQEKPANVQDLNAQKAQQDAAAKAAAEKAAELRALEQRRLAEQEAARNKQVNPLTDPNSPLSQRSIYFDYDSSVVQDSYRPTLQAHAGYLSSHKDAKVTLQGNTDDRGSREYNLALGQRRADSVRKVLNTLGVPESQMEAVSFGEEKPKATGDDEAAWKENRRVDIVYQGE